MSIKYIGPRLFGSQNTVVRVNSQRDIIVTGDQLHEPILFFLNMKRQHLNEWYIISAVDLFHNPDMP